jgi:hypothetical protein
MRMLLGALAVAASIVHAADGARQQVQTLYTSPANQRIDAFAQDDGLVAWFAPAVGPKGCNAVWVWQLGGAQQRLPAQGPKFHNVTCSWQVPPGSPVGLAIAANSGSPALLWSLHESAAQALKFDYVVGAAVADPNERRFQEVAHANHGAGLWLGGLAGSGTTLVYAVAQVEYKDQVACLTTPNVPGACALNVTGGGIYRVVGRRQPQPVRGAPPAVAVAASGTDVAYLPAAPVAGPNGQPMPSATAPVEVRDITTGSLVVSVVPGGSPQAIALSDTVLALLVRTAAGQTLSWYDLTSGKQLGTLPAPKGTAPALSTSGTVIAFRAGRSIRTVDVQSGQLQTLATAAATPVGLSVADNRVAWAENIAGRGRIEAVTLP